MAMNDKKLAKQNDQQAVLPCIDEIRENNSVQTVRRIDVTELTENVAQLERTLAEMRNST